MRNPKLMLVALISAFGLQTAGATPTAEEAAELGKSLTPFGAIKAGNKEGTIPEWTGGICTPPAGYKPEKGLALGGGPYVDPYAADKPLFKITAANMAQYADKLSEGVRELFRLYPQTYYMNVYPSHRSACYPNWMYENTIKRVMNPKIVTPKNPSLTNAHAQVPFPIPKTGYEAMWNTFVRPEIVDSEMRTNNYLIDSSGNVVFLNLQQVYMQDHYWDNTRTSTPEDKPFWALLSITKSPAAQSGTMTMLQKFLRPDQMGAPAWSYIPGQRRVRIAPSFSYDGVSMTSAGMLLYDEVWGFDGPMDRFDFKLIGRKEIYVPYNSYILDKAGDEINKPNHPDPSVIRWELHRLWVVQADLKPTERHVQKTKIMYIDEDSWNILMMVGIDQIGKPHHYIQYHAYQAYDEPAQRKDQYFLYDFSKRAYLQQSKYLTGLNKAAAPYPDGFFTSGSMAGMGLR